MSIYVGKIPSYAAPGAMTRTSITFSLAEQSFDATRSIGVLNVSLKLLESMAVNAAVSDLTVLSNETFRKDFSLPPKAQILCCDEANGRGLRRIIWDQFGVYSAARRSGNRWLFLPKGFVSFVRKPPVRLAAYVHDLMFEFYQQHRLPEFSQLEGHYLRASLKAALRHACVLFTNSESTAHELRQAAERWRIQPRLICPVGIGFSAEPPSSCVKENRIIVATSKWPHKRTELALQYLDQWQRETHFEGLVDLVGGLPQHSVLPPHPNWRVHSRMPEIDYRRLLNSARVMVYFSDYEGFGMPPVEATLVGTGSVYSDIPACSEAMGGLGFSFQNKSYESFRSALNRGLQTDQNTIKAWAQKLLQRHDWKKVGDKVVDTLLTIESSP